MFAEGAVAEAEGFEADETADAVAVVEAVTGAADGLAVAVLGTAEGFEEEGASARGGRGAEERVRENIRHPLALCISLTVGYPLILFASIFDFSYLVAIPVHQTPSLARSRLAPCLSL